VTEQDMNNWLENLLKTKGHQTIKKYVTVVRRVFKVAKKRNKITTNPCVDFTFTPTEAPSRTVNQRRSTTRRRQILDRWRTDLLHRGAGLGTKYFEDALDTRLAECCETPQ
jgi:hypothetical protein